jgi:hypothetical protein
MGKRNLAGKKRFYAETVSLGLYLCASDIIERREVIWQNFLNTIVREAEFIPEMYDPIEEPPRFAFEPSDLAATLDMLMTRGQSVLLERYKPYYMFYSIDSGTIMNAGPINREGISVEASYFDKSENVRAFLSFATKLYGVFKPFYGRACHEHDRNRQNTVYTYFPEGHPYAGQVYSETGFGGNTRQGIPGVYWANFFGRIYVDTIGRDKFLTAPCHERQELDDGAFLLLTSESPLDWEKPDVQELRRAMRDHLGYEYFCDIENQDRVCKVPPFDFSVWEIECDRGMKIPERWKDLPKVKY